MENRNTLSRRKQMEREERESRILVSARQMFLQKGYAKTTIRGIADAAGISSGAIYFYFKNKESMYVRVLEDAFMMLGKMLSEAEAGEENREKKMRAVIKAYYQFYSEFNDHYRLLDTGTVWRGIILPEKSSYFMEMARSHLSIVDSSVQQFLSANGNAVEDTWKLAFNLWAGIEGLFSIDKMGYLDRESYTMDELLEEHLTIFEKGLLSL